MVKLLLVLSSQLITNEIELSSTSPTHLVGVLVAFLRSTVGALSRFPLTSDTMPQAHFDGT